MSTDEYPLYVDEKYIAAAASLAVRNHSPSGHAWGYLGSGPSQTALSLLLAIEVPAAAALQLHHALKEDLVAPLPWPGQVRVTYLATAPGWTAAQGEGPPSLYVASRVIREWYQAQRGRAGKIAPRFAVLLAPQAEDGRPRQLFLPGADEADVRRRLQQQGLLAQLQEIRPA